MKQTKKTIEKPNLVSIKIAIDMHCSTYKDVDMWLSDDDLFKFQEIIDKNEIKHMEVKK